jgi:hypothetical protein
MRLARSESEDLNEKITTLCSVVTQNNSYRRFTTHLVNVFFPIPPYPTLVLIIKRSNGIDSFIWRQDEIQQLAAIKSAVYCHMIFVDSSECQPDDARHF